ncbi:MAG: DUF2254 domain-containing protein [Nitrospirales bacterium]
MPAWIVNVFNKLRSSLWLIPSCMVIAAILLSWTVPYLDTLLSPEDFEELQWLSNMGPESAMTLLSTIAGSMITIAGVVFSITIVVLTLASSQFGPRLLGNFLQDRANQIVLGTFIATFLYCLLVLRTIHVDPNQATPYWGTLLGLLLAVCSLGVLIYFIHHISVCIQAPHLIASVSAELSRDVGRLFPEKIGKERTPTGSRKPLPEVITRLEKDGTEIPAQGNGYLQAIDGDNLIEIAQKENLIVLLHYRPGHFLIQGTPIGTVLADTPITPEVIKSLNKQFICGNERTQEQDIEFSVLQLVEVGVRALSPGVNDPFTCIQCIDQLSANLCQLAQRAFPSPYRYDDEKALRVITCPIRFEGILNAAFHQIRQHGQGNVAVLLRLLEGLERIGMCIKRHEDREAIRRHVTMIQRGSQRSIPERNDLEEIEQRCRNVLSLVSMRKTMTFSPDP